MSTEPVLTKVQEEVLTSFLMNVFEGIIGLEDDYDVANEASVINTILVLAKFAVTGDCSKKEWMDICAMAFEEAEKQEKAIAKIEKPSPSGVLN